MKKNMMALCAAMLLLTACSLREMAGMALGTLAGGGPAPQAVQTASAPLARTTFDESGYRAALAGARTLALSATALARSGVLVRNSPPALRAQGALIALRSSLVAARALLDALNDPVTTLSLSELERKRDEYRQAMRAAEQAADDIGEAISGSRADANTREQVNDAILLIGTATTAADMPVAGTN